MPTHFTPTALKFLRGLARHNDREWFEGRRQTYEHELKEPLLALIGEVNHALQPFAPEHIRPPRKIMMRIYRDTRFSPDKRPYKHHIAAWWARRGMEKTSGGGYYIHIGPKEVMISAGVYMPEREQLLAIRRWMSAHHKEFRKLLGNALRDRSTNRFPLTAIDSQPLTRMPKGFAADDPAGELIRARNWGVHAILPPERALDTGLLADIAHGFRRAAPLVDALNSAIAEHNQSSPQDRPRRFF